MTIIEKTTMDEYHAYRDHPLWQTEGITAELNGNGNPVFVYSDRWMYDMAVKMHGKGLTSKDVTTVTRYCSVSMQLGQAICAWMEMIEADREVKMR